MRAQKLVDITRKLIPIHAESDDEEWKEVSETEFVTSHE